jgi:hypothetical protein
MPQREWPCQLQTVPPPQLVGPSDLLSPPGGGFGRCRHGKLPPSSEPSWGKRPPIPPCTARGSQGRGSKFVPPPPPSVVLLRGKARQHEAAFTPVPLPATHVGWCEPGAQRVSHTLAPFTVLNGPQRPGVCLGGRLGCHLARTRGGNQSFIRLGFNPTHFIFPTTENWIKAALVGGEEGSSPPPWPTHHPHPQQAAFLAHHGWAGSWGGVEAGPHLLARVSFGPRSWLGGGDQENRTEPQSNVPSKAWGEQVWPGCHCPPHIWVQLPAARQAIRAHSRGFRTCFQPAEVVARGSLGSGLVSPLPRTCRVLGLGWHTGD